MRKHLFLVICIFILFRVWFIDYIPQWDSAEYFQALINAFELKQHNLRSIIMGLNWFRHITIGYSLIAFLFQVFDPTNTLTLQIFNITLSIIAIFSFWKICIFFTPKQDISEISLVTIIFTLSPIFIATSIIFVPDFGVGVYFLAFLASYLYKRYYSYLIFGTLLVLTKETGVLLYISFVFTSFIINRFRFNKIILITPLLIYLVFLFVIGTSFWTPDGASVIKFGQGCRFCFALNKFNIYQYSGVFFILNFNWVLTLLVVLSAFKFRPLLNKNKSKDFFSIKIVFLYYYLFFISFVNYIYPRYTFAAQSLLILFFYIYLQSVVVNNLYRKIFYIIVAILLLIQNFKSIDPVSNLYFGTHQLMNNKFTRIGTDYLGDGSTYNTQFIYSQRLIKKFIKEEQITSKDSIFIDPYSWGTFKTGWGNFKEGQPKIYYDLSEISNLPVKIYYLDFPLVKYDQREKLKLEMGYIPNTFTKRVVLEFLLRRYTIHDVKVVTVNNYSITVYNLISF